MKYKKIENKHYNLHLINTNKFESIRVCFKMRLPLIKNEITLNSLLCDVLYYSTKNYPSAKDVYNHTLDLYGAYVNTGTIREGNSCVLSFAISFLDNKYTEDSMLKESIDFINEIIFNPNVDNNKFSEEAVDVCKNYLLGAINSLKDDSASYAQYQMLNHMNSDKSYALNMVGYLEDLNKINSSNLYNHYLKIISDSVVDIYVVGNIKFDQIENLISKAVKFERNNKTSISVFNYENKYKEKEKEENSNNNQSKLSIGCKILNNNTPKIRYPLFLYNIILGASSDSKLFNNIREKESCAYSINSHFESLDSILIINCGIDYKNYDKVVTMIKKEMQDIVDGNITEEEIESAKNMYINAIKLIYDSPTMMIDNYYAESLGYFDDTEKRIEEIKKITKEDIMIFAKDVVIDTIFLLKEEDNNEKD